MQRYEVVQQRRQMLVVVHQPIHRFYGVGNIGELPVLCDQRSNLLPGGVCEQFAHPDDTEGCHGSSAQPILPGGISGEAGAQIDPFLPGKLICVAEQGYDHLHAKAGESTRPCRVDPGRERQITLRLDARHREACNLGRCGGELLC